MNTLVKVGIGVGLVVGAVIAVPSLKGPINRVKNQMSEKLDAEFVVDNYKTEYISMYEKKQKATESLCKLKTEFAVSQKKLAYVNNKKNAAKRMLLEVGTNDLKKFNKFKSVYEAANAEVSNCEMTCEAYSNAIAKLEKSIELLNNNMSKVKANVATLESKKIMFDSLKEVNHVIEEVNCINGGTLALNVEKLDDSILRESIKLEVLADNNDPVIATEVEAKTYIDSL